MAFRAPVVPVERIRQLARHMDYRRCADLCRLPMRRRVGTPGIIQAG